MNDLEARLRETLARVAASTRSTRRIDEVLAARRHRPAVAIVASVALTAGVALIAVTVVATSGIGEGDGAAHLTVAKTATTTLTSMVDPTWLTVEAADLAAFDELPNPGDDPWWRPGLRTETIWCIYVDGSASEGTASGFPLDEELTVAAIEAECTSGTDASQTLESLPATFTVCRGVFTPTEYEHYEMSPENTVVAGSIHDPHPGFPVVLGWESDCVSENLDTNPRVTLDTELSVDTLNAARHLEIAVRGASYTNCLNVDQASQLAGAARSELGEGWLLVDIAGQEATEACYQVWIDSMWGTIFTSTADLPGPMAPSVDATGSGTTLPP